MYCRTIANYITFRLLHGQTGAMEKQIQLMRLEFDKVGVFIIGSNREVQARYFS